jgi:multimeric flavodoxin WrbA
MTLKVVAVNSSPNMEIGNTALILKPFLEGMREEGADVELFYALKLWIRPCQGEFGCATKTLGY